VATYELVTMFGRVLLAATLVVAAVGKLRSQVAFAAFADSLSDLGWRSQWQRRLAAALLPAAELGSAALLAVPASRIWGYVAALVLLLAVTAITGAALKRGRRLRCRCFGRAEETMGVSTLIRNLVLVMAGAAGLASALASAGRAGPAAGQVLGVGAGLLGAVVIVYWADLGYLLRPGPAQPGRDTRPRATS
jgi:hypothetical protein